MRYFISFKRLTALLTSIAVFYCQVAWANPSLIHPHPDPLPERERGIVVGERVAAGLKDAAPTLTKELAVAGLVTVGEKQGVNQEWLTVGSATIRGLMNGVAGIGDGLKQGLSALGIAEGAQRLEPKLGAVGAAGVMLVGSAIVADGLGGGGTRAPPGTEANQNRVAASINKTLTDILSLGGLQKDPKTGEIISTRGNPVGEAIYQSRLSDLVQKAKTVGVGQTVEQYVAQTLLGGATQNAKEVVDILEGKVKKVLWDGKLATEVPISNDGKASLVIQDDNQRMMAMEKTARDVAMEQAMQKALSKAQVISETATEKKVKLADGQEATIKAGAGKGKIEIGPDGKLKNVVAEGKNWKLELDENGQVKRYEEVSELGGQKTTTVIEKQQDGQWERRQEIKKETTGQENVPKNEAKKYTGKDLKAELIQRIGQESAQAILDKISPYLQEGTMPDVEVVARLPDVVPREGVLATTTVANEVGLIYHGDETKNTPTTIRINTKDGSVWVLREGQYTAGVGNTQVGGFGGLETAIGEGGVQLPKEVSVGVVVESQPSQDITITDRYYTTDPLNKVMVYEHTQVNGSSFERTTVTTQPNPLVNTAIDVTLGAVGGGFLWKAIGKEALEQVREELEKQGWKEVLVAVGS